MFLRKWVYAIVLLTAIDRAMADEAFCIKPECFEKPKDKITQEQEALKNAEPKSPLDKAYDHRRLNALNKLWGIYWRRNSTCMSEEDKKRILEYMEKIKQHRIGVEVTSSEEIDKIMQESGLVLGRELEKEINLSCQLPADQRVPQWARENLEHLHLKLMYPLRDRWYWTQKDLRSKRIEDPLNSTVAQQQPVQNTIIINTDGGAARGGGDGSGTSNFSK